MSILSFLATHIIPGPVAAQPPGPLDASLPPGVKAVWDINKAHGEKTPSRERVCLNGLWRFQPAKATAEVPPEGAWGYFKVPGFWPGNTNYIQEDCQVLYAPPAWKEADVRTATAAWYQREITVPKDWAGRRIALSVEYVNSFAVVYVDGKKAGEAHFPAEDVDLTAVCKPGSKHVLSLLVHALPLKGVLLSYNDTNSAREVKGKVDRRGLCGDVFLTSTPAARFTDVKVDTSVRKGEIAISAALDGLAAKGPYALQVKIRENGKIVREFTSKHFQAADLKAGRVSITDKWQPEKLWDLHTPQHLLTAEIALVDAGGNLVDAAYPVRFGFREFWIDGKDFYLNGTRLFLSAVPLDNAQIGARTATYEGARETMRRLQSFGINCVYTHNYGCEPGTHISFTEILRAADDAGMLVAFSQPHFGQYDWKMPDAERNNGYARHAAFYVRVAQNHPSVVAYAMSHNATGYGEDMNPDLIDGLGDPRKDEAWARNNAGLALKAEAIVRALDPGRIVYHHSSGNLGSMHTVNFYANFVPVQEMSDWFEHWASKGVKPVFLCEYGVPFSWDWTMYRGWYKGERAFGSARVPWEFCLAEWNAQFLGDKAYQISEREKENLRWEAGQFKKGNLWHRWDYPHHVGSRDFDERQAVFAQYITDNWRAHRTYGLSANSPWEYQIFWKLKDGAKRTYGLSANSPWEYQIFWKLKDGAKLGRKEFKADWDHLQKPGFSPDYTQRQQGMMSTDYEESDWMPTAAAQALYRNNRPLLAYLGGKAGDFTSKEHNFLPGETVEKQLIVINNSRQTVSGECAWSFGLPKPLTGNSKITVPTGDQECIPLRFELPKSLAAGKYQITATVRFSTGETQTDVFAIDVLPRPTRGAAPGADAPGSGSADVKIALFDPKGHTAKLLAGLGGNKCDMVGAQADLAGYDVLVIGKEALTPDGPGPNLDRVRTGLKVIVFEQTAKVLEQRLGFRVAEYGLRQAFPRVPDHPLLAGLKAEHLHDWRGAATLLPAKLTYTMRPRYGPTVQWCGIDVPHLWRCGCRGNVASVLIEKPARGDFLSIIDGGYALQYSPLLEYREGEGMVLFCQLDVTGRTHQDPAAEQLARNLLHYVAAWKPRPFRPAVYVGDPAGKRHLEAAGFAIGDYVKGKLKVGNVLIVGPGGGAKLAGDAADIRTFLAAGGQVLALGLDQGEAQAFLPVAVTMKKQEHIATYFEPARARSPLAGIAPADVHNRDPRLIPLVTGGKAVPVGNGVLATVDEGEVVFCQIVPWQFEHKTQMNLRRTFRRTSCLMARLLGNMGVAAATPILERFRTPVAAKSEQRWLTGLYLDVPEEWDDPYRFFRW
jgi:hypothetical protein